MATTLEDSTVEVLTLEDVLLIRRRLSATALAGRDFGGPEPISLDLFASAIGRQETGFGGAQKYHRAEEVGATLFYGLISNHPFDNGNKRTALVTLFVFLERNRTLLVETSEDELYELATSVAAHTLLGEEPRPDPDGEVEAIADYLRAHTRPKIRGERAVRGVDSSAFYDLDGQVDYFVNTYRSVLDRLAGA